MNSESKNKSPDKLLHRLTDLLFYSAIFIFIVALAFPHNPAGNWYQQFLPNVNGALIRDITFTDSLTGYSVTSIGGSNSYILKTTNGGDNWSIKFMHNQPFVRVQFINSNTGFTNAFQTIFKTTNAGENWTSINLPGIFGDDMFVLSQDTIWLAMSESLTGGVYRTTNGGVNWDRQLNLGSQNPNRIYMINESIGFISEVNSGSDYTRKTTNSGLNWFVVSSGSGESFYDMYFVDSLTGWGEFFNLRKTTNGGVNWIVQTLPFGGNIIVSQINKFAGLSKDTVWGFGGYINTGLGGRGMIYRTTNGGNNWLFQVPDSNINIFQYFHGDFVSKLNGWAYNPVTGVHTTAGGDPIWLTPVTQISSEVPKDYNLFQNYPNPFNPKTIIRFQIPARSAGGNRLSDVNISVYDIQGKLITELVNQKYNTGTYEVDWNASGFSSGVYFYSLIIDGKVIDTKKMLMIK